MGRERVGGEKGEGGEKMGRKMGREMGGGEKGEGGGRK
jgi:hypothetical protein